MLKGCANIIKHKLKRKIEISLNQIDDISRFAAEAERLAGTVDVCSPDGLSRVSGSSLLGMFSLDLSHPVEAIYTGWDESDYEKFLFLTRHFRPIQEDAKPPVKLTELPGE